MTALRLYDTLTREIRPLAPGDGSRLRIYACGPTVYGPAHIGNFRTFILIDVLIRTARTLDLKPFYVRNLTDVDDKTIKGAHEAGLGLNAFTEEWTARFHEDADALNLERPDIEPKATAHLAEQIDLISRLMAKGHAYQADDGSVYFRVASFPSYGKLSHFDPAQLRTQAANSAGEVNDADEYDREQVADFALWKAHKEADGNVGWDSPWGRGRPGWHLECSAMSRRYLGDNIDLHAGGEDLIFPHHENEIAQSEAASNQPFVRHWMHCLHLLVEGRKMAKSLGNFFTFRDLVAKGYQPREIRYALLSGHYRQQLNFTLHGLQAARSALTRLDHEARRLGAAAGVDDAFWEERAAAPFDGPWGPFAPAWEALLDDLNTPAALGHLFAAIKRIGDRAFAPEEARATAYALRALLGAFGLTVSAAEETASVKVPAEIAAQAQERWEAKQAKDFARADALRDTIQAAGWQVLDRKDGFDLKPAE